MTNNDEDVNNAYNEKVLSSGGWIDQKFLEEVLSQSLEDEVKVTDFQITAAVGAGDNYLSFLYKTTVYFTSSSTDRRQQRHLMIKGVPSAKILLDMIEDMGIFRKEIAIYGQCLPAMYRALRANFPEDAPFVAPDSYKCSRVNTLVMEDLCEAGYKMSSRLNQLNFEHSAATLRTLARFHALSVKVHEEDPELIMQCATEFYKELNRDKMEIYLDTSYPAVAKAIESSGEFARFAPIIREAGFCIWDKVMKLVEPSAVFNVLNHGDMWVNNILYKYGVDGHVTNAKLVDFQLSRYGSPALDLHYFFFTSLQAEVLTNHMDELLGLYYEALMSDLTLLGVSVNYSFEQLHEDMRDRAAFGILALTQILPIIIAPPSDAVDVGSFDIDEFKPDEDHHPLTKNYRNAGYQEVAGKFLKHMESVGYLKDAKERLQHVVDEALAKKESLRQVKSVNVEE